MHLQLIVRNKKVSIKLYLRKKKIDILAFREENNLSEKLLPAIDEIIRKNKLIAADIKNIEAITDTPDSFTTSRIAATVGKGWNFAVKKL